MLIVSVIVLFKHCKGVFIFARSTQSLYYGMNNEDRYDQCFDLFKPFLFLLQVVEFAETGGAAEATIGLVDALLNWVKSNMSTPRQASSDTDSNLQLVFGAQCMYIRLCTAFSCTKVLCS